MLDLFPCWLCIWYMRKVQINTNAFNVLASLSLIQFGNYDLRQFQLIQHVSYMQAVKLISIRLAPLTRMVTDSDCTCMVVLEYLVVHIHTQTHTHAHTHMHTHMHTQSTHTIISLLIAD